MEIVKKDVYPASFERGLEVRKIQSPAEGNDGRNHFIPLNSDLNALKELRKAIEEVSYIFMPA